MLSQRLTAVAAMLSMFALLPGSVRAQTIDHIVPLSDIRRDAAAAASQRSKNLADIDRALTSEAAKEQFSRAHVSGEQVKAAVAHLDDKELAQLAERARAANADIVAGGHGEMYFIVGLAVTITLIVVLTQTI